MTTMKVSCPDACRKSRAVPMPEDRGHTDPVFGHRPAHQAGFS